MAPAACYSHYALLYGTEPTDDGFSWQLGREWSRTGAGSIRITSRHHPGRVKLVKNSFGQGRGRSQAQLGFLLFGMELDASFDAPESKVGIPKLEMVIRGGKVSYRCTASRPVSNIAKAEAAGGSR